jgi:Family of unknown function (DUF5701)
MDEFDRQLDELASRGVGRSGDAGGGDKEFRREFEPLRALCSQVPTRDSMAAGADFVAGKSKRGVLDRNHGEEGLRSYRDLPELGVREEAPYVLVGVERGEEFCNVRPGDAVQEIAARGRTPLTLLEGVILQLVRPDLLIKNHCFMLAGSRRGDRRVPACGFRPALTSVREGSAMNFENLPKNWHEEPVDRPDRMADVLDLLVNERARESGSLLVLICDGNGRLMAPCMIEELPPDLDAEQCQQTLSGFFDAIRATEEAASVLLAVARPDGLSVTDADRQWREVALQLCGDDVRLLGVHLVTLHGTRPVAA